MSLVIRHMNSGDARAFLEVHHSAVRQIAAKDYPVAVVEDWAPLPITEEAIEHVRANPENEVRLVAEIEGRIAGIGVLITETAELRACYVAPEASRKGVGSALVREIERIARGHGLTFLRLTSSITAEPFYAALGYQILGHGRHTLNSGQVMACVRMRRDLAPLEP